jgi:hypothetical protein
MNYIFFWLHVPAIACDSRTISGGQILVWILINEPCLVLLYTSRRLLLLGISTIKFLAAACTHVYVCMYVCMYVAFMYVDFYICIHGH